MNVTLALALSKVFFSRFCRLYRENIEDFAKTGRRLFLLSRHNSGTVRDVTKLFASEDAQRMPHRLCTGADLQGGGATGEIAPP